MLKVVLIVSFFLASAFGQFNFACSSSINQQGLVLKALYSNRVGHSDNYILSLANNNGLIQNDLDTYGAWNITGLMSSLHSSSSVLQFHTIAGLSQGQVQVSIPASDSASCYFVLLTWVMNSQFQIMLGELQFSHANVQSSRQEVEAVNQIAARTTCDSAASDITSAVDVSVESATWDSIDIKNSFSSAITNVGFSVVEASGAGNIAIGGYTPTSQNLGTITTNNAKAFTVLIQCNNGSGSFPLNVTMTYTCGGSGRTVYGTTNANCS